MRNKNKNSYFKLILFIWKRLKNRRRTQLKLLILLMLLNSFAEVFSLASVIPFLSVMGNPNIIWEHPWVVYLRPIFGFESSSDLLLPVTFLFGLSAILAALLRLSTFRFNGDLI